MAGGKNFEALKTLQDIDYSKFIVNQTTKDLLWKSTISTQNSLGKSVPEFGDVAILMLIPIFIIVVFASRMNKLGVKW